MDMEIVFPNGKKVNAIYKGFTIETDQPEREGGDGLAPSPFDLFLASIGTCMGFYALSFCQERSISTQGLKLQLGVERNPETGLIGRISVEIRLSPEFPAKYREAVRRAVELCTVKKHLQSPPIFEITAIVEELKPAAVAPGGMR